MSSKVIRSHGLHLLIRKHLSNNSDKMSLNIEESSGFSANRCLLSSKTTVITHACSSRFSPVFQLITPQMLNFSLDWGWGGGGGGGVSDV